MPAKKKKRKSDKKRKKKKKHKKKSGRRSGSSGSDSDTVYPSDLKKEEEAEKYRHRVMLSFVHMLILQHHTVKLLCICQFRHRAPAVATHFSWLDDVQSPTEQPFCVDRKADPANWTYKSLYRGDVAR